MLPHGVDLSIEALHAIRLALELYGNGPPGLPYIHQTIRLLSAGAKPGTIDRAIADALAAHYQISLTP